MLQLAMNDQELNQRSGRRASTGEVAICIVPGCGKPTWNGRAVGKYCSKECRHKPICMRPGCGKATFNGRPSGYCSKECRNEDQPRGGAPAKAAHYDPWKDKGAQKRLDDLVETKLLLMPEKERDSVLGKQEFAKGEILRARTALEVLEKADVYIEEDWIKNSGIPGNIYRIGAFGRIQGNILGFSWAAFSENPVASIVPLVRAYGSISIWLLQLIGPPAIFLSTMSLQGVERGRKIDWVHWQPSVSDWQHVAMTKILSMTCINIFCLNGLFVVLEEMKSWAKIESIVRYLNARTKGGQEGQAVGYMAMVYIDAITNIWVVLWCCCVDSIVVIGVSASPKDVLFDSLGLLFLYNLDDITSGLGFVTQADWHGGKIGWIYQEMVTEDWANNANNADPDSSNNCEPFDTEQRDCAAQMIMFMFRATIFLIGLSAVSLPVISALTPFLEISPDDN